MSLKTTFFSILLLLGLSCSTKEENTTFVSISNELTTLSEIIDTFHYVQFQLPEGIQIGGIDQVIHFEDYLLVLDGQIGRQLLIFNNEGEFIHRIANAPDLGVLLMWPSWMQVHESARQIHLIDGSFQLYYMFDFEGNLIGKKALEEGFTRFLLASETQIFTDHAHSKTPGFSLVLRDSSLKREKEFWPVHPPFEGLHLGSVISANSKYPFYIPALSNKVYAISTLEEPRLRWELGFPSGWPSVEQLEKIAHLAPMEFSKEFRKDYPFLSQSFENKHIFALSFYDGDFEANVVFINKRTNKAVGGIDYQDDLNMGSPKKLVGQKEEFFISYLYPQELLAQMESYSKNPKLSPLLEGLDRDSQPILLYYAIKNSR